MKPIRGDSGRINSFRDILIGEILIALRMPRIACFLVIAYIVIY